MKTELKVALKDAERYRCRIRISAVKQITKGAASQQRKKYGSALLLR
jgi:hypothetical protein